MSEHSGTFIEFETQGRHGSPLKVSYLTYEEYCRKCGLEPSPVARQLWVQYTRQCGDTVRFNELFREVGRMK